MSDFAIGAKVRLTTQPPYLKTADPMPMLRPPSLVTVGEEGVAIARNPGGTWSIKFERGTFLIDDRYLESA